MKKIKTMLVAFFCVFALTGCYKVNIELSVDKDLKTEGTMEVLMKKDLGSSTEDLLTQFEASGKKSYEVIDRDIKRTIDGEEYIGIKIGSDKLEDIFPTATLKEKDDKIELSIPFISDDTQFSPEASGEEFDPATAKAMGVEMNLTINMPGKITSAKEGEISGSKVTYNLFSIKEKTIKVVSEKSNDYTTVIIFAGLAIAAIAVGFILFKMRKNKRSEEASPDEAVAIMEEVSEEIEPTPEEEKPEENTNENNN